MNIVTVAWLLTMTFSGTDYQIISQEFSSSKGCVAVGQVMLAAWNRSNDLRTVEVACAPVNKNRGIGL